MGFIRRIKVTYQSSKLILSAGIT